MKTIHAIFENGVFRPTQPVDLPEGSEVILEPRAASGVEELSAHQKRIHELLRQQVDTDDPGLSGRHNEHQP